MTETDISAFLNSLDISIEHVDASKPQCAVEDWLV